MFERFTDRARKVMALANQEAQRRNHEFIGTEHILLGIVKEGSGVGATVLKNLGVDLKKLRVEVEKLVQAGPNMITMGKLPQTPRARHVIEYAIEEARALHHSHVGTEHILLGLLRETDGIAAQVLTNLGLKLEDVRQEVLNLLGADTGRTSDAPLWGMGPEVPWVEMPVRLGDRARRVMASASREAQQSHQEYVQTEHVLLALVEEGNGVAAVALRHLGVDGQNLRPAIEKLVPRGPSTAPPGGPAPSNPVEEAIWRATEEARRQNCDFADTGHLLLALIRDPESTAARALMSLGPKLDTIREKVLELRASGCNDEPRPLYGIETRPSESSDQRLTDTREENSRCMPFTDRARKVMALANQEAQRFNQEYIGTEHILLGLLKEGSGRGATALENLGVDLKQLRKEIEKLVKRGPVMISMGKLPNTPRARQVIVYAIEEARALHHSYVGTEHLLLGLLRQTDGIAAQVLIKLGLKLEDVRQEVLALLGAGPDRESGRHLPEVRQGHSRFGRLVKRARKWMRVGGEDPMYERFTDRARKVMALANQEAQRLNHEYIGTEHLLLGLALEGSGVGATVIKKFGVDLAALRAEVEKLVQRGPGIVLMGKLPQTPRAKTAIMYAIEEARALNHNYVGTEHILLGLLRESEGIAAQVLMNLGLQLETVRHEVLRLLGAAEGPAPAGAGERKPGAPSYKDLPVWQKADELAQQVYAVTGTFPPEQIAGVASRLRELALSIPPHIAEAPSRPMPGEARWVPNAAFVSLRELRYLLDFAKRLEDLKAEDHQKLAGLAEELDQLLRCFCAAPGP